jgi:hypothetical protein
LSSTPAGEGGLGAIIVVKTRGNRVLARALDV